MFGYVGCLIALSECIRCVQAMSWLRTETQRRTYLSSFVDMAHRILSLALHLSASFFFLYMAESHLRTAAVQKIKRYEGTSTAYLKNTI
jgi:hypothetical protein